MTFALASKNARVHAIAFCVCGWLAIIAASACTGDVGKPLGVGDPAPDIGERSPRPELIWAFRQESAMGCSLDPVAAELASLARRYENRIGIVVVAVGGERGEDRRLVENFLVQRRVPAAAVPATPRVHARMFGAAALPSLYLAHQGVVHMVANLPPGAPLDDEMAAFALGIEEFLTTADR